MAMLFLVLSILSVFTAIGLLIGSVAANSMLYFVGALFCLFLTWVFFKVSDQYSLF